MATFYWAWFNANGERTAFKERICIECAATELKALLNHAADESDSLSMCPACGGNSESDQDPIYLTLFPPRQASRQYELATCAPCAAKIRIPVVENGERLPDRGTSGEGPLNSTPSPWDGF